MEFSETFIFKLLSYQVILFSRFSNSEGSSFEKIKPQNPILKFCIKWPYMPTCNIWSFELYFSKRIGAKVFNFELYLP